MRRFFCALNVAVVVVGSLVLGGCGSGAYNEKFEVARAMPVPQQNPIVGAWEGTWQGQDGHAGELRAILTPTGNPHEYIADFDAKWGGMFTHQSKVTLTGKRIGNKLVFEGREDLGMLAGGVYEYEGQITPAYFQCQYTSPNHVGTYELHRPNGVSPFAEQ